MRDRRRADRGVGRNGWGNGIRGSRGGRFHCQADAYEATGPQQNQSAEDGPEDWEHLAALSGEEPSDAKSKTNNEPKGAEDNEQANDYGFRRLFVHAAGRCRLQVSCVSERYEDSDSEDRADDK